MHSFEMMTKRVTQLYYGFETNFKKNIVNLSTAWSPCQGVPKMTNRKKILTKIECCGAKFSHKHDLGVLDPA